MKIAFLKNSLNLLSAEQMKDIKGGDDEMSFENGDACIGHKKSCNPYSGALCCAANPTCARFDSSNPTGYYCGKVGNGW